MSVHFLSGKISYAGFGPFPISNAMSVSVRGLTRLGSIDNTELTGDQTHKIRNGRMGHGPAIQLSKDIKRGRAIGCAVTEYGRMFVLYKYCTTARQAEASRLSITVFGLSYENVKTPPKIAWIFGGVSLWARSQESNLVSGGYESPMVFRSTRPQRNRAAGVCLWPKGGGPAGS